MIAIWDKQTNTDLTLLLRQKYPITAELVIPKLGEPRDPTSMIIHRALCVIFLLVVCAYIAIAARRQGVLACQLFAHQGLKSSGLSDLPGIGFKSGI
ncbi:hypothetical protein D3C72_1801380 [compost metagenome]